jgi:hypothetical protein
MLQRRTGVCAWRHCCAALTRGIRADLRARIAQADSDVDALGAMLRETQQEQGDRIISLEKKVASLESENSGLQQLLRISIDDTARLKAEKEAALKQLRHAEVGIKCHVTCDLWRAQRRAGQSAWSSTSHTLLQDSTREELLQLRDGIAAGTRSSFIVIVRWSSPAAASSALLESPHSLQPLRGSRMQKLLCEARSRGRA